MRYSYSYINLANLLLIILTVITSLGHTTKNQFEDPLEAQYGKLQHASILFRHGDRSPLSSYPNDPHCNYPWPGGFQQLLNKGKRRMYELGKWFKTRYNHLVGDRYKPELILVQSSDLDRAIVSGECFLHGFYPPGPSEVWKENETWQPIPVHTIPKDYDNLINFGLTKKCPYVKEMIKTVNSGKRVEKLHDDNIKTIEYMEKYISNDTSQLTKIERVQRVNAVGGILKVQAENNLTLPEWTTAVYPVPLSSLRLALFKLKIQDKILQRLMIGRVRWMMSMGSDDEGGGIQKRPILKQIISDMNAKIRNPESTLALHVYSGHDTIIDILRIALNIFDDLRSQYGSTLMFELRKNSTHYLVTLLWKNETGGPAHMVTLPGCTNAACTFETFVSVTSSLIPEDWDAECNSQSNQSSKMLPNIGFISSIAMLLYFVCN